MTADNVIVIYLEAASHPVMFVILSLDKYSVLQCVMLSFILLGGFKVHPRVPESP